MRIQLSCLLFFTMSIFLLVPQHNGNAETSTTPRTNVSACNQNKGIAEVFYNFDSLIIFYESFPHPDDEKLPGYPDDLKFGNFNARLIAALKNNFEHCIKKTISPDKEIVVLPPALRRGDLKQQYDLHLGRINDPKNLTIEVNVDYHPGQAVTAAADEYAQISFYFYRPEIPFKPARLPLPNNSGILTLFTKRTDVTIGEQLDRFFTRMKPAGKSVSNIAVDRFSGKSPEWVEEMTKEINGESD